MDSFWGVVATGAIVLIAIFTANILDEQRAQTRALQSIQASASFIVTTRPPLGDPECICEAPKP